MSLFNLIEKNHAVGLTANLFGELTALVISDVARRRAYELGDCVFLHELGHIKSYHCAFIAEKCCGKSFAELCLTYTCRSEEDE